MGCLMELNPLSSTSSRVKSPYKYLKYELTLEIFIQIRFCLLKAKSINRKVMWVLKKCKIISLVSHMATRENNF
jgi:hypothetical protein